MVYITLFISAFISATLFPLGSEALLVYNLLQNHPWQALLLVATLGNTLGSGVNYYLGLKGEAFLEKKGYLKEQSIQKYKKFFNQYGAWVLLLSWVPIIGDPITFIAGVLKYDIKKFVLLVFVAKLGRYAVLVYITLS
jgi:membrane protein YqaA with SNARE-associated domain